MAAIKNPERYHIISFSANFALSGGVIFAKDSEDNYFVVSEFARSEINSRRYPYQGIIEDNSYLFTETGQTSTGLYTLFCVDGIIDSSEGGGSEGSSSPDEGAGVPAAANYRESAALQALNAMIQMVPNPTAYKESTVRLLTQKAFEFSNEFLKQASLVREETGEGDGPAGGGGGGTTPISSQSLNGLPAITKVVFCTSYPANGEQRTLYVKLKKREQGEGA